MKGRGSPPRDVYRVLHANLLTWFAAADPQLADQLHDRPVRKPFTASALRQDHQGWRWRVTLLVDELQPALMAGVRKVATLNLNGHRVPVAWPSARVDGDTYEELLTRIQSDTYIRTGFVSPTTFRAGRLDSPLPEPSAVFHSWLSRWNDFAPPARRMSTEILDLVHERVAIAEIRHLHTERHDLGRSSPAGFVGQVTYVITGARSINQADIWRLNALAHYADFCGTGRKTTQGMGQTRRLNSG